MTHGLFCKCPDLFRRSSEHFYQDLVYLWHQNDRPGLEGNPTKLILHLISLMASASCGPWPKLATPVHAHIKQGPWFGKASRIPLLLAWPRNTRSENTNFLPGNFDMKTEVLGNNDRRVMPHLPTIPLFVVEVSEKHINDVHDECCLVKLMVP